jgi:O-antigen ligase
MNMIEAKFSVLKKFFAVYLLVVFLSAFNYFWNPLLCELTPALLLWLALGYVLVIQDGAIFFPRDWLSGVIYLFFGWLFVAIFLSAVRYGGVLGFLTIGQLPLVFLLCSLVRPVDDCWRFFKKLLFIITVVYALFLMVYFFTNNSMTVFFLNKNLNATCFNLVVFLLVADFFNIKANNTKKTNRYLLFGIFVLSLAIFLVNSRAALIGFFFSLIVLLLCLFKRIEKKKVFLLIMAIVLAIVVKLLLMYLLVVLQPQNTTTLLSGASFAQRLIIWQGSLKTLLAVPWYGSGLYSFALIYPKFMLYADNSNHLYAHNDYLQILIELGYFGLILLLTMMVVVFSRLVGFIKKRGSSDNLFEVVGLFCAMLAVAVHSLVSFCFYFLPVILLIGIYLWRFNLLTNLEQRLIKIPQTIVIRCLFLIVIFLPLAVSARLLVANYYSRRAGLAFNSSDYIKSLQNYKLANTFYQRDVYEMRQGLIFLILLQKASKQNSNEYLLTYQTSLQFLHNAIKINSYNAMSYNILGLLYNLSPYPVASDKTAKALRKAVAINPASYKWRLDYAKFLYNNNQTAKAVEVLQEGLKYRNLDLLPADDYMALLNKIRAKAPG